MFTHWVGLVCYNGHQQRWDRCEGFIFSWLLSLTHPHFLSEWKQPSLIDLWTMIQLHVELNIYLFIYGMFQTICTFAGDWGTHCMSCFYFSDLLFTLSQCPRGQDIRVAARQNIASVSGTMYRRCWVISWLVWKMINEVMKGQHALMWPLWLTTATTKTKTKSWIRGGYHGGVYSLLKLLWDSLLFQTKQRSLF